MRKRIYKINDPIPLVDKHNHDDYRKKFGPGHWDYLHRVAASAVDEDSKWIVIDMIEKECETFGCDSCRADFSKIWNDYYKNEVMYTDNYWYRYDKINGIPREVGMLKLTIDMHNDVNAKLGKPIMNVHDAFDLYLKGCEEFVCKDH